MTGKELDEPQKTYGNGNKSRFYNLPVAAANRLNTHDCVGYKVCRISQ